MESRIDRFVLPFMRDPALWPILVIFVAHIAAFVAPVLLFALRDGRIPSFAALFGLAGLSIGLVRHESLDRGRPGPLSGLTLATWLVAIAAAFAANHYGII